MKKVLASGLFLSLFILYVGAATRNPRNDVLGLRLGMSEEATHRRLQRIGHQQKEEKDSEREGEQEVWLLRNPRLDYAVLRFDREHKLWHLTVVARKGSNVRYAELGNIKDASQATDGRNYTYTWNVNPRSRSGYVVIARGSDPNYLTSYSIFRSFH